MADFYRVGEGEFTQAALDKAALENHGVVLSIGYGYATCARPKSPQHGYHLRWVNTRGMGNHGDLILTPASPRAAELLRQGWVRWAQSEFGIGPVLAETLYTASRGIQHGREPGVLRCVLTQLQHPELARRAWAAYPGAGRGVWRWADVWQVDTCGCTAPRLDAVASLVRRIQLGQAGGAS